MVITLFGHKFINTYWYKAITGNINHAVAMKKCVNNSLVVSIMTTV